MKKIVAMILLIVFVLSACNTSTSSDVVSTDPIDNSDNETIISPDTYEPPFEPEDVDLPQPPPTSASPPPRRPVPPGQLDAIRYAQGNAANSGIVTEDEDNIFFVNHHDRSAIYVFNKHTQEVRKLEGTYHAARLHLRGEYIYYTGSNYEAGFYTYRIRIDGSGRERAFEERGNVLYFPQNENEPYFMHLFPERRQYLLNRQTGEMTFVFDELFVSDVTSDNLGRMWFIDFNSITNPLTSFRLFEYSVLFDEAEAKAIDISARLPVSLQYLDGYVYYREIGIREGGTIFRINTQTYEEAVIVLGDPTVEVRVSDDNIISAFLGPMAATTADRITFHNLLVTGEYIFSSTILPRDENEDVGMTIIRICRDTLEFWTLYDSRDEIDDIYGPMLIGIADGKIFFTTLAYPGGNYQYTRVMDFQGNRLDRQFGLINPDTPN